MKSPAACFYIHIVELNLKYERQRFPIILFRYAAVTVGAKQGHVDKHRYKLNTGTAVLTSVSDVYSWHYLVSLNYPNFYLNLIGLNIFYIIIWSCILDFHSHSMYYLLSRASHISNKQASRESQGSQLSK